VTRRLTGPVLACAFALAASAPTRALGAQHWRDLTASRQVLKVDTLHVRLSFTAGKIALAAAPQSLLYDVHLKYDADHYRPQQRYDAATHTLTIRSDSGSAGIFSVGAGRGGIHFGGGGGGGDDAGELSLALARDVPLDLSLGLAACEARVDLGGLSVSALRVQTAACDTRIAFSTPNPSRIPQLEIRATAAGVTMEKLGNARADRLDVITTVGGADLDLSGDWSGTMTVAIHTVMGGVTLRVPQDVGIQARVTRVFGRLEASFLSERNGAFYSANWSSASRKLVVDADATMGGVELVRLGQ